MQGILKSVFGLDHDVDVGVRQQTHTLANKKVLATATYGIMLHTVLFRRCYLAGLFMLSQKVRGSLIY